jgi:hypothetical protein
MSTTPTAGSAGADLAALEERVDTFANDYEAQAEGKAGIQKGMDTVRAWFNRDAEGKGHGDDQFKNIANTRHALDEIKADIAAGRLSEAQAQHKLTQLEAGFEGEAQRVADAQATNAKVGQAVHGAGRIATVAAAGVAGTVAGGGVNVFTGVAAAVAAGSAYDAATVGAGALDQRMGNGTNKVLAPELNANQSVGGVAARALTGEHIDAKDLLDAGVGTTLDAVSGFGAGQGIQATRAAVAVTTTTTQAAKAAAGASVKTGLQQSALTFGVQTTGTALDPTLTAQQKKEQIASNAVDTAKGLPGQIVFSGLGGAAGVAVQPANKVVDGVTQVAMDGASNVGETSLTNVIDGQGPQLTAEQWASAGVMSGSGALQNIYQRPPQEQAPQAQTPQPRAAQDAVEPRNDIVPFARGSAEDGRATSADDAVAAVRQQLNMNDLQEAIGLSMTPEHIASVNAGIAQQRADGVITASMIQGGDDAGGEALTAQQRGHLQDLFRSGQIDALNDQVLLSSLAQQGVFNGQVAGLNDKSFKNLYLDIYNGSSGAAPNPALGARLFDVWDGAKPLPDRRAGDTASEPLPPDAQRLAAIGTANDTPYEALVALRMGGLSIDQIEQFAQTGRVASNTMHAAEHASDVQIPGGYGHDVHNVVKAPGTANAFAQVESFLRPSDDEPPRPRTTFGNGDGTPTAPPEVLSATADALQARLPKVYGDMTSAQIIDAANLRTSEIAVEYKAPDTVTFHVGSRRPAQVVPPGGGAMSMREYGRTLIDFAHTLESGNVTYRGQATGDIIESTHLRDKTLFMLRDGNDPNKLATMTGSTKHYDDIRALSGEAFEAGDYAYLGQLVGGPLPGAGAEQVAALQNLVANSAARDDMPDLKGVALYTNNPGNIQMYLNWGFRMTAVRVDEDSGKYGYYFRYSPKLNEGASAALYAHADAQGSVSPTVGVPVQRPWPEAGESQVPLLPQGDEQVPRNNPRDMSDVTVATRQLRDYASQSDEYKNELADFLVSANAATYANRDAALDALDKADQVYVLRDAQNAVIGTAALTRTNPREWYLGQVAAASRSGAGGDMMGWVLGDFKQLADHDRQPVRLWAYTNKPENIYNARDPSQPGFYAKWGAQINDPNPAGSDDMQSRRRIDFEWRFGDPPPAQRNESTDTDDGGDGGASAGRPNVPDADPQGGGAATNADVEPSTASTTSQSPNLYQPMMQGLFDPSTDSPSTNWDDLSFTTEDRSPFMNPPSFDELTQGDLQGVPRQFQRPVSDSQAIDPMDFSRIDPLDVDTPELDRVARWMDNPLLLAWDLPDAPIAGTRAVASGLNELATPLRSAVQAGVANTPAAVRSLAQRVWEALPEQDRALLQQVGGRINEVLDEHVGQRLRDIGQRIGESAPVQAMRDTMLAGASTFLLDPKTHRLEALASKVGGEIVSPAYQLGVGGAKAVGEIVYKGSVYLMVAEMAMGGPKMMVYDPTSNQPIESEALETLNIHFVPQQGSTHAVVMQSNLLPDAKVVMYGTGLTVREGIPRLDQKNVDGSTWQRFINTYQAAPLVFGVGASYGNPNAHVFRSFSVRPLELGANPPTIEFNPALGAQTRNYVAASTFINGDLAGVRLGPGAATGMRDIYNIGSLFETTLGSNGAFAKGFANGDVVGSQTKVLQTNPAFDPTLAWDESFRFPTDAPVDARWESTDGALSVEHDLFVDPKSGWMAVMSDGNDTPLYVPAEVANAAKLAGQRRAGAFDAQAFARNPQGAGADQMIQGLQTTEGRIAVMQRILSLAIERSPPGHYELDAGIAAFTDQIADADSRELVRRNAAYFRDLLQPGAQRQ